MHTGAECATFELHCALTRKANRLAERLPYRVDLGQALDKQALVFTRGLFSKQVSSTYEIIL